MLRDRCLVCLSVTLAYCGRTAVWIKMPIGTEVGLGQSDIMLDRDPSTSPKERGTAAPTFRPMIVYCGQTVTHLSYC